MSHKKAFKSFKPKQKTVFHQSSSLIDEMSDYMFTTYNVQRLSNHIKQKQKQKTTEFYTPKQRDTLFWCFYILKNGYVNYEIEINNQYFQIERSEKYKYVELLRQKKDILKLYQIKPFCEIENNLAYNDEISIKTFFALCAIEELNVLLIKNRKIFEISSASSSSLDVIQFCKNKYSIHLEKINNEIVEQWKKDFYIMPSFDSKLKSISSYKINELQDLCKKLNINIGEQKLNKKEMYNLLEKQF
jgi:hypothetical protein